VALLAERQLGDVGAENRTVDGQPVVGHGPVVQPDRATRHVPPGLAVGGGEASPDYKRVKFWVAVTMPQE